MINKDVEEYIVDPLLAWLRQQWGGSFFSDSSAIPQYCLWSQCLSGDVVDAALQQAEQNGFVRGVHDKYADSYYSLTAEGIAYIDRREGDVATVLGKRAVFGDAWVRSALARIVASNSDEPLLAVSPQLDNEQLVPASDRSVTINHNQPEYLEAVAALDKVIEEFRSDQRLDNELGHEKGALLKALEGGRELLNDTVINVRIGTALILEPLWRLVEKYEHALVGAAAQAAYDLIKMLFS